MLRKISNFCITNCNKFYIDGCMIDPAGSKKEHYEQKTYAFGLNQRKYCPYGVIVQKTKIDGEYLTGRVSFTEEGKEKLISAIRGLNQYSFSKKHRMAK